LKEDEEEVIINERPETYYRAINSEEKCREFETAAISFADIWLEAKSIIIDTHPWRVMNLNEHNKKFEDEQKRKRHRREGKRKRNNKIICRERRKEREQKIKRLEREEKKQRFRVRGQGWKAGKDKFKLKKLSNSVSKPKYRTE